MVSAGDDGANARMSKVVMPKCRLSSCQIQEHKRIEAQAAELAAYELKLQHLTYQMIEIDLDDGVNVNYAKFADVLVKVK